MFSCIVSADEPADQITKTPDSDPGPDAENPQQGSFRFQIPDILDDAFRGELSEESEDKKTEISVSDLDLNDAVRAERLYKIAFVENFTLSERERILCEVVQKFPNSEWAQDALWVLAQLAKASGQHSTYIMWYRRLIEDFPEPSLHSFTTQQPPFHNSNLPRILYLIEQYGRRYARGEGRVYTFNPVPFSVRYELALAYESFGYLNLAEREYKNALNSLPPIDFPQKLIQQRLDSIGKVLPDMGD